MATLCNTSVGLSRGTARIWLEGTKLERGGFLPGTSYNRSIQQDKIILTAVSDGGGDYVVSKRIKNELIKPIIDMKTKEIDSTFCNVGDEIRVFIRGGVIIISESLQSAAVAERIERILNKLDANHELRISSCYHGAGILDRAVHDGFALAGIKTKLAVAIEIDPGYLDCSMRNNKEIWDDKTIAVESDVTKVDFINSAPVLSEGVVMGIPCTSASRAGRAKKGLTFAEEDSKAGGLIFESLNFIVKSNPAFVLIENVPEYASTASAAMLRSVLRSLKYTFSESVFAGSEFGVLENRKRWVFVAVSEGLNDFVDFFNVDELVGGLESKVGTLGDVMEEVPDDSPAWKAFDYLAKKEVRDIEAGKGFRRQLLGRAATSVGTVGRLYNKCRSTEPFVQSESNPALSRLLTVKEHAAIKGIPLALVNNMPVGQQHECLGQAIIYPQFVAVGEFLANHLAMISSSRTIQKAA